MWYSFLPSHFIASSWYLFQEKQTFSRVAGLVSWKGTATALTRVSILVAVVWYWRDWLDEKSKIQHVKIQAVRWLEDSFHCGSPITSGKNLIIDSGVVRGCIAVPNYYFLRAMTWKSTSHRSHDWIQENIFVTFSLTEYDNVRWS